MPQPTRPAAVRMVQYWPFCQRLLTPMAQPFSNCSGREMMRGIGSLMGVTPGTEPGRGPRGIVFRLAPSGAPRYHRRTMNATTTHGPACPAARLKGQPAWLLGLVALLAWQGWLTLGL